MDVHKRGIPNFLVSTKEREDQSLDKPCRFESVDVSSGHKPAQRKSRMFFRNARKSLESHELESISAVKQWADSFGIRTLRYALLCSRPMLRYFHPTARGKEGDSPASDRLPCEPTLDSPFPVPCSLCQSYRQQQHRARGPMYINCLYPFCVGHSG